MKPQKLFLLLACVWLILNVLTASLMEIHPDEAYYHLFGQYLDWGYYDHPPMVGLMAHMSDWAGTVRGVTVLLFAATLWLIWQTTAYQRAVTHSFVLTFFLLAAGLVMFSTAGFMLTPDSPLLFFVALFFYAYQQYADSNRPWLWAMVLGVSVAGMIYSKYMGVLVVLLVVMSNWRLIKDGRLWCALGLALVLLLPHLYWLYAHDWATVRFHLVTRHEGFAWRNILEYWPNQLLVFNPLTLVLMLSAGVGCFKHSNAPFDRALAATILGFPIFFWFMSLKGHAEPHWTMAASVPAIILLTRYLQDGIVVWMQRAWLKWTLVSMVVLCLVARVVLWTNMLPFQTNLGSKRPYYDIIHSVCGDRVMVTAGSFQDPSLYRFWEGEAVLLRDIHTRHTQYELLDLDYVYQGKPACIVASCPNARDTMVQGEHLSVWQVEHLQMTDRMVLNLLSAEVRGDSVFGSFVLSNPYAVAFDWNHHQMPVQLWLASPMPEGYSFSTCRVAGPQQILPNDSATYAFAANWRVLAAAESQQVTCQFVLFGGVTLTPASPQLFLNVSQ